MKFLYHICFICILFIAAYGTISSPDNSYASPAKKNNTQVLSPSQKSLIEKLNGRVLYHRPDGVYLSYVNDGKEHLLAKGGSYPRWSQDGTSFVFLRGNNVMLYHLQSRKESKLARAQKPRALCFAENGKAVLFTDGKLLRRVELDTLKVSTVLSKGHYLEIDMSHDGKVIAATMKSLIGYKVVIFTYPDLKSITIDRGCSTSLSPDGQYVTVNDLNHKGLHLYNTKTGKKKKVPAPKEIRFDNQFWSNHPEWIASSSEGKFNDIFIHHTTRNITHRITFNGNSDRADLFIPLK